MAVVNTLSTLISNFDAQPRVLSSGYVSGGSDTITVGTVAAVSTDSIGSTYRFGFLSSGVRVQDIQLMNDATTAGVWQCGVYNNDQQACTTVTAGVSTTTAAGAVSVTNANVIFGTGISTAVANTVYKSIYAPTVLNGANAAINANKRVWELLNLDSDPEYVFHLVLTATTAPTANGNITLQYSFVR
ncbi:MAG TPA: hypothetical protein VMU47_06840 [Caldimonas sp.]|nr:hypothetical protein [Caldimonas sp.]